MGANIGVDDTIPERGVRVSGATYRVAQVRFIVWCKACAAPSRSGPRRAGPATWRPDHRSRLVRAADVLAVRQPRGPHGGQRDQAAVIRLRELAGRAAGLADRASKGSDA